jgi:predicted nucleotidyltransferase
MVEVLFNRIDEIVSLCKKHKVKAISVFGSAARNAMTASSDIDFLVQFSEEIDVLDYADNYFSFLESLEQITGRKIDLLSVNALRNPVLKEEINRSKIDLYAA